MKLFFIFTKRGLTVVLAAFVAALITAGWFFSLKANDIEVLTHSDRMEYLRSLGYEVEQTDITSKEIIIPSKFTDVYENYNSLQKQSGFDLSNYKGKKATVYGYYLSPTKDKVLHLIICENRIIGGDISDVAADGEMKPIK